jgi:hypothetical protein
MNGKTQRHPLRFLALIVLTFGMALGAQLYAQDTSSPSDQQYPTQQPSQDSTQQPQQQPKQAPDQSTQSAPDPQAQSQPGVQTFTGTIMKSGDKYVLQDADSGTTYDIDHQDQVKQFEGKKVRVHGTLDPSSKTIHVQ